ncbi:MAG: tryptophan-rich sensory protein [Gemmatimonadota bacterium]|nr:tryptophan-rich sensory protein [Gemmatimonadota bacterium]MDH5196758.1 tryptophan-rich sensory protein [Gemmatimonadota bacterium]
MTRLAAVARFLAFLLIPVAVGAGSGFLTVGAVREWYPSLVRPSFAPPSWVFGPVWTVLYLMMGLAAYLVWRHRAHEDRVRAALALFAGQLVLNGLWSVLFFGVRSPGLALVEIVVLWVAIAATLRAFWQINVPAGALLLPYLGWVSFATALNAGFWFLNRAG